MSIRFDDKRWTATKTNYRNWWDGKLDRPLLNYTLSGYDSDRPPAGIPGHYFTAFHPPEVTPDQIVDTWDYGLSRQKFLGDAFPVGFPNFGPGVMAAFSGCDLHNDTNTVWFHDPRKLPIEKIKIEFRPDSPWLLRVRDIMAAAQKRWKGSVQVAMTDLGGALDIIASFRGSEALLMDLYDSPDEVLRLVDETHAAWWKYRDLLDAVLRPAGPGHSAWATIFSEEPYYMLQCDFAYMIGPEMFDRFVKPELAACCRKMKHAFYHLDGIGQLPHLDSLLAIPELAGVQWIPGDGQKPAAEWPDVLRRIRDAGKRVQIYGGGNLQAIDRLADQLGGLKGVIVVDSLPREREDETVKFLERYGAM